MKTLLSIILLTSVALLHGCCSLPKPPNSGVALSVIAWWDPETADSIVCVPIVSNIGRDSLHMPQLHTSVTTEDIAEEDAVDGYASRDTYWLGDFRMPPVQLGSGQRMFTRVTIRDVDVNTPAVLLIVQCGGSVPDRWKAKAGPTAWSGEMEHQLTLQKESALVLVSGRITTNLFKLLPENVWVVDSEQLLLSAELAP